MRTLLAIFKFFLFTLLVLFIPPLQFIMLLLGNDRAIYILPQLFNKIACRIFCIRYSIIGTPDHTHQTVFTSNHLSYLDIPLLGGLLPCSFLAKQEVEGWALFGFLAKLSKTIFIVRRKTALVKAKNELADFLKSGRSMIVFPEGTSTSGLSVKPFKSSIFSIADTRPTLWFQPITIALKTVNGKRAGTVDEYNIYAWPLEMDTPLHVHLWRFAHTSGAHLEITFHPSIPAAGHDRKTLAKACHDSVSMGLQRALAAA